MTDDGDEPVSLSTIGLVAGIVGAAGSLAGTGLALSKGGPNLPTVKPPPPPPAPPPAPPALPPPPTATEAGEAVGKERRKRASRFGISDTLLASPLGGGSDLRVPGQSRSLLGG